MRDTPECEFEWMAIPGYVTLLDGDRVYVEPGDMITGYETEDGAICFTQLAKRTMHS